MTVTTLRPGLLVSLNTRVQGNVSYRKAIIEEEHITDEGTQMARWETERTVLDPAEAETAKKVRGKARSLITGVCAASAFGLLCRLDRQGDLEDAIAEARRWSRRRQRCGGGSSNQQRGSRFARSDERGC
jgi:hypothetical protein